MDGGIRLEYRPVKDDETRYNVTIRTQQDIVDSGAQASRAFSVEMVLKQTVFEIMSDELFSMLYTVEYSMMEQEGSYQELPDKGKSYVVDMRKNGEIVKSSLPLPFSQPSFPDEPLGPGSTWIRESEIEIPAGITVMGTFGEKVRIAYEYALSDIVLIDDVECAVIEVHSPERVIEVEPDFRAVMRGQGTVYFACEAGKIYGFSNSSETTITTQGVEVKSTTSFEMNIHREITSSSVMA